MFVDVEQRTATMVCKSVGELDVGPYGTDYVFILTMTEDGTKVERLFEWPDFTQVENTLKKLSLLIDGN